jgi:hypothetical protein
MIKNIFTSLFVATLVAALSSAAMAQQPFDTLPAEDQQQNPAEDAAQQPLELPSDQQPKTPFSAEDSAFQDTEPDQKVQVDERVAGWQAAGEGTNGDRLSKTLRGSWVMTDANGMISGNVRGVDGAEPAGMVVYLLNQGRIVTTNVADPKGNFVFNNVVEGAYSIVGIGENAFFAFGLDIVRFSEPATATIPMRLDITAFQNKTSINLDWIKFFSPRVVFRVFGRYSSGEEAEDPAKFYGFAGLANNYPEAAPATSINSHRVVMVADGRLLGRVHQINSLHGRPVNLRNAKVMLLKADDVYSSTTIDNYGIFEFTGVAPGQYGLVAAGLDGIGCIGIDVVEPNKNSVIAADSGANVFDFCMATSETVGWLNHLADELAYERAILAPRPPQQRKYTCPACVKLSSPQKGIIYNSARALDGFFDYRIYGEVPKVLDLKQGTYPNPGGAFGSPQRDLGRNSTRDKYLSIPGGYYDENDKFIPSDSYNNGGGYYGSGLNGGGYNYGNGYYGGGYPNGSGYNYGSGYPSGNGYNNGSGYPSGNGYNYGSGYPNGSCPTCGGN